MAYLVGLHVRFFLAGRPTPSDRTPTAGEDDEPPGADDAASVPTLAVLQHNQIVTQRLLLKVWELLTTNGVLQGHSAGGGGPGTGNMSMGCVTTGLTKAILRTACVTVFYEVSGYYGFEEVTACVADQQNLNMTKAGNKAALRSYVSSSGAPTSTNLRAAVMREYLDITKDTVETFIPGLDVFLALEDSGHTAGEFITTDTLVAFVDQADFNGMPSMLKAMREISNKMKAPNPNYIAPAFLATVLLSFLVKKKLVSNLVLVSTVVASHRTISCFVDQVNDQSPKVHYEVVRLRLVERMYTLDAWNGLDKDAKLDVTTD